MSVKCNTAEELGKAIKNKEDTIEIEGDLKNQVIRIKATGKVAWGVCVVSLGVAVIAYLSIPAATAGATPVGGAVSALSGGSAAVPAVMIGVAAGGIGALNTLRDKYKIVEKNKKCIKLKRK